MDGYFFLHNPKAGGTAIRQELARRFGPTETAPTINLVPEVYTQVLRPGLVRGYRFYAGHYGYTDYRTLGGAHTLITNFRHPATRILSLYNYFRHSVPDTAALREAPEYHAVRFARDVDFDVFVACEDPRVATYTHDHHFRQLSGSGWSLAEGATLEEVRDLIDDLAWYYVCEYPVLSVLWGRKALALPDLVVGHANVTGGGLRPSELLGETSFLTLLEHNRRDVAIYNHALGRFFREVADLTSQRTRDESSPTRCEGQFVGLTAAPMQARAVGG